MPRIAPEHREITPAFEAAVFNLLGETQATLERKFGNRPYHNAPHAGNIDVRSNAMLRLVSPVLAEPISRREFYLTRVASKAHDVFQPSDKEALMERTPEQASADWITNKMEAYNAAQGQIIFTAEDKFIVREAILATTAEFKSGSVIRQPYLKQATSPVTVAIALADLNGAGIEGRSSHLRDTRNLFLEMNEGVNSLDENTKKTKLVDWLKTQGDFIRDRQQTIPQDIAGISQDVLPEAGKTVLTIYCTKNLVDSLNANNEILFRAATLSFDGIMELLENGTNKDKIKIVTS